MQPAALSALIDATWPAARMRDTGGWRLRDGRGGGSRVSAATALEPGGTADPGVAAEGMRALGQAPLFMVRHGEDRLEAELAEEGYVPLSPTRFYRAPVERLAEPGEAGWPAPDAAVEIWAAGGIGPERLAVMERVTAPRAVALSFEEDVPAATGFAVRHGDHVVLHAIETRAALRRRGHARRVIASLAGWGAGQGAREVSLLVTEANRPANALYAAMGFVADGGYHYRARPEAA